MKEKSTEIDFKTRRPLRTHSFVSRALCLRHFNGTSWPCESPHCSLYAPPRPPTQLPFPFIFAIISQLCGGRFHTLCNYCRIWLHQTVGQRHLAACARRCITFPLLQNATPLAFLNSACYQQITEKRPNAPTILQSQSNPDSPSQGSTSSFIPYGFFWPKNGSFWLNIA